MGDDSRATGREDAMRPSLRRSRKERNSRRGVQGDDTAIGPRAHPAEHRDDPRARAATHTVFDVRSLAMR